MDVDKIAFTGGTVTGRKIMAAATGNIKKVTLELGGKSPCIVFADADFDVALEFSMFAIFAGQGECAAQVRGLSSNENWPIVFSRDSPKLAKIIVGDGLDPRTEMGPLITPQHMERVLGYIDAGRAEGARPLCGGGRHGRGRDGGQFCRADSLRDTRPR